MEKEFKIPKLKFELKYKERVKQEMLFTLKTSEDCVKAFRALFHPKNMEWYEEAYVLCVNRNNKVIGGFKLSSGGTSGTIIDPKLIFSQALKLPISGIVIAHNHPSGNLNPSRADRDITKKVKKGGELLDIVLLDHIIITSESYYSFADNNELQ
ncbi:JAB domain-containing protein [Marinilongibacter aquaticus]|uniref:JAB domain-containing protein n=1 Tax=Marinilongibacter aquaticus TaxID=2975157 RepID=UPI0021BDE88B|nr:JAB domain-containing protein [Marinilongibacter aquaticus]UBM58237.1 JAB domain-containing protein [Marinilongibacter aquaticus]